MELLVRIRDKINLNDPYFHDMLTKRGDVIVVKSDGHAWGKEEIANPEWIIIRVPLSRSEAEALLAGTLISNGDRQILRRKREFRLNVDALPARLQTAMTYDGKRTATVVDATVTEIRGVREQKPAWQDPNVIG